jgi:cytolysin (calcineurin-like family phosphatase)
VTLDEQATYLGVDANRSKILQAACLAAANVAAEAASTPHHTLRADLATQVLNAPLAWEEAFARAVAAQPAVTTAPTDNDILFTVNSLWDAMAGAPGPA